MTSPLVFSEPKRSSELSRAVQRGTARRLARGVYSFDLRTPSEDLIRRNWLEIVGHFFPSAVISDRSRVASIPDSNGLLFIVHERERALELPGLLVLPRKGAPPLPDDIVLPGLWLSSYARALVENLLPSRAVKGRPRRTLTERELHDWIARLARTEGPEKLNRIRDRARELADELGLATEFPRLDAIFGATQGTREVETTSTSLRAAQRGRAFDERREATFEKLAEYLDARAPSSRLVLADDLPRLKTLPFFEAYFSNFIEGTEFTLEEASRIVFEGVLPKERPADAHDVLGTYGVVSDEAQMRLRPRDTGELIDLLKARHARVLEGRPEKNPGALKQLANRAGSTEFVAPELVEGTLARGFDLMGRLSDPFARAVFMMFLVSEVHPFDDGNGRVARIMMNAELVEAGEHRIIIPTVFRNEYLSALRAMTHQRSPGALTRVLDFAQRYTAQMDFSTVARASELLTATQAFVDPAEALERGLRLTLPSALER